MPELDETTPEQLPKSNDPSLEEVAERVKLGGPGDMPPPPGYDPNSGLPPASAPDEPRTVLGDVPHPELRAPVPGAEPGAPAPVSKPVRKLSTNIFEIDSGTLPPHRFAALFPPMSPSEYEGLVISIAGSGQEYLAVRFHGQLLDGRNRDRACKQLGVNLQIVDFLGTEEDAFDHVVNVNRFRRKLTQSQCGTVGAKLMPYISPDVEKGRVEKIRAARKLLGHKDTETWALMPGSKSTPDKPVRARDIAAAIVGVSPRYVEMAMRVEREDPELFEKIWLGQITITAAIRILDGVTETESAREIKTLRRLMNNAFRDPEVDPDLLVELRRVLDRFGIRA